MSKEERDERWKMRRDLLTSCSSCGGSWRDGYRKIRDDFYPTTTCRDPFHTPTKENEQK